MPPEHSSPLTAKLPLPACMVSVPGTPRSVPDDVVVGLACSASPHGHTSLPGRLELVLSRLYAAGALLTSPLTVTAKLPLPACMDMLKIKWHLIWLPGPDILTV